MFAAVGVVQFSTDEQTTSSRIVPKGGTIMTWSYYVAYFFAGAFLANSIPHVVQGICGNKFQTPLASPPAVGESSPVINVLWAFFNIAVGGWLLHYFWPPVLPPPLTGCVAGFAGALLTALWLAMHFSSVRKEAPHP
jgi:hypothetical protein